MRAPRFDVVTAARRWIGTPYRHQAARRGAGCDCLGLIRGVWREIAGQEPESPPAYSMDWSEPQGEERLWAAAARHLIEQSRDAPVLPGDVLLFRMRRGAVAKHLGICAALGPVPRFIHAYCGHGVVENPLSGPWRERMVSHFTFPQGAK